MPKDASYFVEKIVGVDRDGALRCPHSHPRSSSSSSSSCSVFQLFVDEHKGAGETPTHCKQTPAPRSHSPFDNIHRNLLAVLLQNRIATADVCFTNMPAMRGKAGQ